MSAYKKVFTLRLNEKIFDKIEYLAQQEHRSVTNLIEYVLINHLNNYERENGEIEITGEKI